MNGGARVMGIETEYGVAGVGRGGSPFPRAPLLGALVGLARSRVPHVADAHGDGLFLRNGARFYVDVGMHPEMTTPECQDPCEVVRYARAGERILLELATELERTAPELGEILILRSNVDYSGAGSTWGCHESHLHRAAPEDLAGQLIPHLVSRVIYTGAGGFNNLSPGLEFTLSPRVPHITRIVSGSSTYDRGIFHTKNEPLSGHGYQRLHVVFGDTLCSDLALWLRVGTTALIVALIEAGCRPGEAVALRSPLNALRSFAVDPWCRVRVRRLSDGMTTALAIQRHYLEEVERRLSGDILPPWAGTVCETWRDILDRLERDPRSLAASLDWAVKLAAYENHARSRSIDWKLLPFWTEILRQLVAAFPGEQPPGSLVTAERILASDSPARDTVAELTPQLRRRRLDWDGLAGFLALRRELFELDTRFGRLGERGIFEALDRQGCLAHRIFGTDEIDEAMSAPPPGGRAQVRGRCIERCAPAGRRYLCTWDALWDTEANTVLDLSNPFEEQERWIPRPPPPPASGPRESFLRRIAREHMGLFGD